MITDKKNFLKWFRDAAPYIREHSGKTFVIQIKNCEVSFQTWFGIQYISL